jgi:single-strand DNA-binding protein
MNNLVVLVGRIVSEVEVEELEDGRKRSKLCIAVQRPYKNEDGIYETDFIDVIIWNAIAENTAEYCKKGDLIGIKGRLQTEIVDDKKKLLTIADRVTFLASTRG